MGRLQWLLLLGLASGCAAHHGPDRIISTDWAAVRALPPQTDLAISARSGDVTGRLVDVTDSVLTLRQPGGTIALARGDIRAVGVRTPAGTTRAETIVKTTIGAAVVSGLVAAVMASVDENGSARGSEWGVLVAGTAAGAALGALRPPKQKFHQQLVYLHQ